MNYLYRKYADSLKGSERIDPPLPVSVVEGDCLIGTGVALARHTGSTFVVFTDGVEDGGEGPGWYTDEWVVHREVEHHAVTDAGPYLVRVMFEGQIPELPPERRGVPSEAFEYVEAKAVEPHSWGLEVHEPKPSTTGRGTR